MNENSTQEEAANATAATGRELERSSSKKTTQNDEKKQKEIEMAKEYQKVTRSLAREISKKDGFSLVTHTEEVKAEPIPEEPVEEPQDGFRTETTFKSATMLLLSLEVQ
jgi:DNA topoisomerase VI subunit B